MYDNFARGYYNVMKNTFQNDFADYYKKIIDKYKIPNNLILDLGCGSGDITYIMANSGYDMIGIDISCDMLNIANEINKNDNIMYLCQDMREFELYGTVGMIYSSMDCINYITDKRDLKKVFKLCNNYLDYDGLFVFDVNTIYKFYNILDNNTFVYDTENEYLVWQNEYDKKSKLCNFYLDMFYKDNGSYKRHYDEQQQRAYEVDELKVMLKKAGFVVENICNELSFSKVKKTTERAFFICRKVK